MCELARLGARIDGGMAYPLHAAAQRGHADVVRELIALGAAVEWQDLDGTNTLCHAAQSGNAEVVRELIEGGAEDTKNKDGMGAIHFAAEGGFVEVGKVLRVIGADVGCADDHGKTPLLIAVENGRVEFASWLLDCGVEVDVIGRSISGEEQVSPLMSASSRGDRRMVEMLVKRGAKVDEKGLLFVAARDGYVGVVECLLRHGAETGCAETYATTPLYVAAEEGHTDVVRVLLQYNADINAGYNAMSGVQVTPLFAAAQQGHAEVVKELMRFGARMENDGAQNLAPLHIAMANGHAEVVDLLTRYENSGILAMGSGGGGVEGIGGGDGENYAQQKKYRPYSSSSQPRFGNRKSNSKVAN